MTRNDPVAGGDLRKFHRFCGTLSAGALSMPIRFKARIGDDGEVELDIRAFRISAKTRFVESHWADDTDGVPDFTLVGTTEDGLRFETESLSFRSLGETFSGTSNWHRSKPRGECSKVVFVRDLKQPVEKTFVKLHLKGFECFGQLRSDCSLGKIAVAGMDELQHADSLAGYIVVEAENAPPDAAAWKQEADALIEHLRSILSFGSATVLHAPILEFVHGSVQEIEVVSQTPQHVSVMRVFHKFDQQALLDAGVTSFFNPPIETKNLAFAIEWFAMSAVYKEVRLVNAMTSLENLVDSNLTKEESLIQTRNGFDKMKRTLRTVIKEHLATLLGDGADEARSEIAGKLLDLNRRPFRSKLLLLANRWGVPLDDINDAQIRGAINARNSVVHSGHFPGRGSDDDLWDHMIVARELVVRFLLTAIGFRGRYISHLGGHHRTRFPPKRSESR